MKIFCPKCMNDQMEVHDDGYQCPECGHVVFDAADAMMDVLSFYADDENWSSQAVAEDCGRRARLVLGREEAA